VTAQRIKTWLRGNVTGFFGVLLVFGRRIKEMIRLRPEQVWMCNVTVTPYRECGQDSRPRNVSKVGYAVTLRAFRCAVGIWPYHPFDATAKYRQHTEQARNVTA
jgi:hypothetical protein